MHCVAAEAGRRLEASSTRRRPTPSCRRSDTGDDSKRRPLSVVSSALPAWLSARFSWSLRCGPEQSGYVTNILRRRVIKRRPPQPLPPPRDIQRSYSRRHPTSRRAALLVGEPHAASAPKAPSAPAPPAPVATNAPITFDEVVQTSRRPAVPQSAPPAPSGAPSRTALSTLAGTSKADGDDW